MTAPATRPDFPIAELLPGILDSLAAHPRLVLEAPPGAGKTTQVPLALLSAPWRGDGRILMLEPRRVAARAAAGFMARQLGESPGDTVGYRIRFEAKVSARTRIEVVTEGILTRMIQDDPTLEGVAAIVFDEFHERHLAGDLGLALALDVQSQLREDLRILVMSATLDGEKLARFLDAPRLTSAGRSYPVAVAHFPARRDEPLMAQLKRCVVVVASLDAAYDEARRILGGQLADLQKETSRGAKSITPVDLNTGEIYDILRKRLFTKLPDPDGDEVDRVSQAYLATYQEAVRGRALAKSAEQMADEIVGSYPFHPSYKDILSLFKENEKFRQTRGLIQFTANLMRGVWGRKDREEVFLIGAQFLDFSDALNLDALIEPWRPQTP